MDEVFVAYLRAKLAAEEDLLARSALATTVLRPGGLTDDAGHRPGHPGAACGPGSVPATTSLPSCVALLDRPDDGAVVELVSGSTPVDEAVAAVG